MIPLRGLIGSYPTGYRKNNSLVISLKILNWLLTVPTHIKGWLVLGQSWNHDCILIIALINSTCQFLNIFTSPCTPAIAQSPHDETTASKEIDLKCFRFTMRPSDSSSRTDHPQKSCLILILLSRSMNHNLVPLLHTSLIN